MIPVKIDSLHLSNFRIHRDLTIPFAPVTLIVGSNGQGKSTVMAALEYVNAGRCILTNEKGLNGDLVSRGQRSGAITVNLADGQSYSRTTDGALSMSWSPRTKAGDAQHDLDRHIGCKGDAARLSIRASRFFGMDSRTQKTLLSDMVGLDIKPGDVIEALATRAKVVDLPLIDVCKEVAGAPSRWDNLGAAYKAVFEDRTACKRLAKELGHQVEAYVDDGEVFTSEATLAEMATRHKEMVTELQTLCHEHGKLLGSAKALESANQSLEQAAVGYKDAWASAFSLGAVHGDGPPSDWETDTETPDADNSEVLIATLESEAHSNNAITALLSQLSREWVAAKESVAGLESELSKAGMCPYAAGTACAGAALRQQAVSDQLETAKDRLLMLAARLEDVRDTVRAQRSNVTIQTELTAARTARDSALKSAHIRESAVLRLQHATTALDQERKRVAELTVAADAARVAEIEAYKPGLASAVEQLAGELDLLRANAALKAQRDSTRQRFAAAEAKVKCLEELCDFFAPNGYQAEALALSMGGLIAAVNNVCGRWGMAVRYTGIDLLMEVCVGGEWFEWKCLADSTQILVGLAHQVAFATMEGSSTGFVVVDRIESLDDDSQATLFAACEEIAQSTPGLHHIILLGVRSICPPASVSWVDLSAKCAVAA